jgi:predicted ester cyclase
MILMANRFMEVFMSIEENKALIHKIYDLMSRKELTAAWELLDPSYTVHAGNHDLSLDQDKDVQIVVFSAFPDFTATIENMVAEDDKVAVRVTWRGNHKGEFMGIAPTGKKVETTGLAIYRIVNGKLTDDWVASRQSVIDQIANPSP